MASLGRIEFHSETFERIALASDKVLMDRNQSRMALLKATALVLLGTTWVFWSFVYATRPEAVSPSTTPLEALIRLPASLPAVVQPTTKVLPPIEMNVAALDCWDLKNESDRSTDARWVRLTGRACDFRGNSENVTVKNTSNGYSATVFDSNGRLTTDFIPLQMGKNDILIRFEKGRDLAVESRFVFIRQQ